MDKFHIIFSNRRYTWVIGNTSDTHGVDDITKTPKITLHASLRLNVSASKNCNDVTNPSHQISETLLSNPPTLPRPSDTLQKPTLSGDLMVKPTKSVWHSTYNFADGGHRN